jgi:hypothetical protein
MLPARSQSLAVTTWDPEAAFFVFQLYVIRGGASGIRFDAVDVDAALDHGHMVPLPKRGRPPGSKNKPKEA